MESTRVNSFRLTKGEEKALEELARAGFVMEPEDFTDITKSSAIRRAIREAWNTCPDTKDKPFPGGES